MATREGCPYPPQKTHTLRCCPPPPPSSSTQTNGETVSDNQLMGQRRPDICLSRHVIHQNVFSNRRTVSSVSGLA